MNNILKKIRNYCFSSERDRMTWISYWVMFITYSIIGYVGDIDILKIGQFSMTPHETSIKMSFVAVFLPALNAYLIWYFYNKWK